MSKATCTGLLFACVLYLGGCSGNKLPQGKFTPEQMREIPLAHNYDLPPASGGMVLSVYSEVIGVEEILNMTEKTLKPAAQRLQKDAFEAGALPYVLQAVQGKVTDILIYQEARKDAPENMAEALDKAVTAETTRFITSYGNNYALAEKKIKEMGMDWRSFREYQKKLITTQSYISTTFKQERRFSYQEMLDYYNRIRNEQFCKTSVVEFSLIDIVPDQLKPEQVKENQTASDAALELVDEVTMRLQAGEDFAELAKQFSHGPLAPVGGKMRPVTVGAGSLPKPYDVLETTAVQMQPGQVKGPIENQGHVFVLKLDSYQPGGCKPFEEVQNLIAEQMQFEYRQQQYMEFVNKLVEKAKIDQMERFVRFCTDEAWRRWATVQTASVDQQDTGS